MGIFDIDMIEDYVLSGFFFEAHFSHMWSFLFFLTADATLSFSAVHFTDLCSTVLFQTKLPCLLIHAGRQKGSHSLYSRGFQ